MPISVISLMKCFQSGAFRPLDLFDAIISCLNLMKCFQFGSFRPLHVFDDIISLMKYFQFGPFRPLDLFNNIISLMKCFQFGAFRPLNVFADIISLVKCFHFGPFRPFDLFDNIISLTKCFHFGPFRPLDVFDDIISLMKCFHFGPFRPLDVFDEDEDEEEDDEDLSGISISEAIEELFTAGTITGEKKRDPTNTTSMVQMVTMEVDLEQHQQHHELEAIFSNDEDKCLEAVIQLKNKLIGSNKQKNAIIQQGVVPRLLGLLSSSHDPLLKVWDGVIPD